MDKTRISFRMDRAMKEQAQAILKEEGWSLSGYIENALRLIVSDPEKNYPLLTGKPFPTK